MSELERKAVKRLVDLAEKLGVADQVPPRVREIAMGHMPTNGGAMMWWSQNDQLPEVDWPVGCCIGGDMFGPEWCSCWVPVFDLVQQQPGPGQLLDSPLKAKPQDGLCHDCAFRKNSPERQMGGPFEDELLEMATSQTDVFMCHQGIKRPVRWVHPDGREVEGSPADYQPLYVDGIPYQADGEPALICGGYNIRRERFLNDAKVHPYWLEELADMHERKEILPGGMVWEDLPPANRGGGALTRGRDPLRTASRHVGSQRAPRPGEAPVMPTRVRLQIVKMLQDNPGRWARVYDGGRSSSAAVAGWFRRIGHDRWLDVSAHRDGLTIAVYVRYLSIKQDFFAPVDGQVTR